MCSVTSIMRVALLAALFAVSSCGRTEPSWPEPPPPHVGIVEPMPDAGGPERAARFVGLWLVDQPYHARYEASFYALSAAGSVSLVDSYGLATGPLPAERQTGVVSPSLQSTLLCRFGSRWRSVEERRLIITADCTDGVPRDVELRFESQPSQNASPDGATVSLGTVDGETGWVHPGFEWRFKKCRPGPPMVPSGRCE